MDGATVRDIRERLGLTQTEFGEIVGLSRDYVGQIERGKAPVKSRTATAIRQLCRFESLPSKLRSADPMEQLVECAFQQAGIKYITEMDGETPGHLDFFLPDFGVSVEVKRFHSPRISNQMSRVDNVIAIQGEGAVRAFCTMLVEAKTSKLASDFVARYGRCDTFD